MSLQFLLHSSKTMRSSRLNQPHGSPQLLPQAKELVQLWCRAGQDEIETLMKVSTQKAGEVVQLYADWSLDADKQSPAVDSFVGDIYSGLQAQAWTRADRQYAHKYLLILSGLYGGLRACDGIMPYRLEMGYKLPNQLSLYKFWGNSIASLVDKQAEYLINLSAVEYTKALLPYTPVSVITPKFLTISPKTGQPTFVTVHTKIARGAFANWLIKNRISQSSDLVNFAEIGYSFRADLSTAEQPVFVCQEFGGLGLSQRLK